MNTNRIFDGLALVAALVIIVGVGSAAVSAFQAPMNISLNSAAPASLNS